LVGHKVGDHLLVKAGVIIEKVSSEVLCMLAFTSLCHAIKLNAGKRRIAVELKIKNNRGVQILRG